MDPLLIKACSWIRTPHALFALLHRHTSYVYLINALHGYVGGPFGSVGTVSRSLVSAPQSTLVAPADHQTQLRNLVCLVFPQVQGHPVHSNQGGRCPNVVCGNPVLLVKDVIEPVPPTDMRSGFVSPYFIVAKKSGWLRPILNLQVLIRVPHKLPFKMLTQ